jgi:hypothetical protein
MCAFLGIATDRLKVLNVRSDLGHLLLIISSILHRKMINNLKNKLVLNILLY